MDDLIIRALQGRATPEELSELQQQRDRLPEVDRRFREIEQIWKMTSVAAPAMHKGRAPDLAAMIARADAQRSAEAHKARPNVWIKRIKVGVMAAALAAISFGVGKYSFNDAPPPVIAESEIITGAGEMTTVTLADGSSVRLGPRSRVRLSENDVERVAVLEGRAFFGVKANPARQFVVRTKFGEAVVHGTRFEVRSEDNEFSVLVVDGKVHVAAAGSQADLGASEMVRSPAGGVLTSARIDEDDIYAHLAWMGNSLVFQATPVEKALLEIERRYGVQTVLENPMLADISVTATFTDQKVEEIVHVLCEIINARCSVSNNKVRVGIVGPASRSGRG